MPWLTTAQFKGKFNVAGLDLQIAAASESAALQMRAALSDAAYYTEAIGAAPTTPADKVLRYNNVVQSHGYLTFWYLLRDSGHKFSSEGVVKSAQDTGSPAMSGGVLTNQYLTPAELKIKKDEALEAAKLFIGDYGLITLGDDGIAEESVTSLNISSLKWF